MTDPLAAFGLIGWSLVHSTWQVMVLAAMLRLGEWSAPGVAPAARYRIGFCTLLAVPTLLFVTLILIPQIPLFASAGEFESTPAGAAGPLTAMTPTGALQVLAQVTPVLGMAWSAWAVLSAIRWGGGLWLLGRSAKAGDSLSTEYQQLVSAAAARVGVDRPVRALLSGAVEGPSVVGHQCPTVLLPETFLNAATLDEVRAVVAHELAHVKRSDFLQNAIQKLMRSVFAFHPAVRWMCARLDVQREQACDEIAAAALADRRRYAASLARLEILRVSRRSLALAANGSPLLDRVRRLAGPPPVAVDRRTWYRLAATVAMCVLILLLGTAATLPASSRALHRVTTPAGFTINATDPAGEFTLSLRGGRAVAATVAGEVLSSAQLMQQRSEVTLLPSPPHQPFVVRIVGDGIRWDARTPVND
jgi:beta-lactamase regulating signal transducer with metallopeptidase domain